MAPLLPLLLFLLLPRLLLLPQLGMDSREECLWKVALNKFDNLGGEKDVMFKVKPVRHVAEIFKNLGESAIDPKDSMFYMGFPYYLKISFTCYQENKAAIIRKGYLTGLKPIALVAFQSPLNTKKWKPEQLEIEMEAAPYPIQNCKFDELCSLNWFTPMPIKNGSVVMKVKIYSNHLGLSVEEKTFSININGFVEQRKDGVTSSLGEEVQNWPLFMMESAKSQPIWSTHNHAPVLILGGIHNQKIVLLSDTAFEDFTMVELAIDSCWLGSISCPQIESSSTILDAIAMESTLFIRQNQLIYYFTGNYYLRARSRRWTRTLHNLCIKKLCPVFFPSNGTEHVLALGAGNEEGYIFFGSVKDGKVDFVRTPPNKNVCDRLKMFPCYIEWALYDSENFEFYFLMKTLLENKTRFFILNYFPSTDRLQVNYEIPAFIPEGYNYSFVMLLGLETYSTKPLIPKGISYNPFTDLFFIWGNAILQSYDRINYIFLSEFQGPSPIKYFISSFRGEIAFVTENEEIWYFFEGSYSIFRLCPSEGWQVFLDMQHIQNGEDYSPNETMISLFFDHEGLQQLVYIFEEDVTQHRSRKKLIKRKFPISRVLEYQQLGMFSYNVEILESKRFINFASVCPFISMRIEDLPAPQRYTRQERYRAQPPDVLHPLGFHTNVSLAIYQGLVYHLLWLHWKYNKPYADPVHDPTWSWWRNKKSYQDYYTYLASNWKSQGGVHINMEHYSKIYHLSPQKQLPESIYLDKGNDYAFSIFISTDLGGCSLTARQCPNLLGTERREFQRFSHYVRLAGMVSHPKCLALTMVRKDLISRNAIRYQVTISDRHMCFGQDLSGANLMMTSALFKIVGSAGNCFKKTSRGTKMQGHNMISVFIGCPPGKRLAFDITYTMEYTSTKNKHFFDCTYHVPEMPCFLFKDVFYPFFLIQDMVTGESGRFTGSYILKVIGGGPSMAEIRDYSEEEISQYNKPEESSPSLIWEALEKTSEKKKKLNIMSWKNPGIVDVDNSTYCDYHLIFILHLHGLPFSSGPAVNYLMVSTGFFLGLIVLYVFCQLIKAKVTETWNQIKKRIQEMTTFRSESFFSSSPSSSSSSLQPRSSSRATSIQSQHPSESPWPSRLRWPNPWRATHPSIYPIQKQEEKQE
ncbi:cation channel sperm-associated protein subunit gamma isoform X2 [Ornithorhynchus anatinus]|uniref:cation channel sperm-associated protein subunit gamma isoform X2 n=1 Tax=Ornithorhynchus anatinus TaxID=9258 RepID=UPI0010A7A3A9|nr:cation channel sperm-associated protein subunit gamma isoform X2 [Ornithorhynchus anatinus]